MGRSYHSREVIRLLEKRGFVLRSIKGSHHKFVGKDGRKVVVPHPKKDLRLGTFLAILDQAGLSSKDMEN